MNSVLKGFDSVQKPPATYSLSEHHNFQFMRGGSIMSFDIDSIDNRFLLCGLSDGSLSVFDVNNYNGRVPFAAQQIAGVKRGGPGAHQYSVSCVRWYPHDLGLFVSSSNDKQCKLWSSDQMSVIEKYSFEHPIRWVDMSPVPCHKALIAVATSISHVSIIDIRVGSAMQQLRGGHESSVCMVRWSPRDASILASSATDGRIAIWDVRSGKSCLKTLSASLRKGAVAVNGLKFTPDGHHLLAWDSTGQLCWWDAIDLRSTPIKKLSIEYDSRKFVQRSTAFELSFDRRFCGRGLVFMPIDDDVCVIDFESAKIVQQLKAHQQPVNCCVYRLHYGELFSAAADKSLLVWSGYSTEKQADYSSLMQDDWGD